MKRINTSTLSPDECQSVQINGTKYCKDCKWTGISTCNGQNILKTGKNSKYFDIGENGIINNNNCSNQ